MLVVVCGVVVRVLLGGDVLPSLPLPPVHVGDRLLLLLPAALVRLVPPLGMVMHAGLMAALVCASTSPVLPFAEASVVIPS